MNKRSFTIGRIVIKNNILLAPMAGITDASFRRLCREHGCGMTYSEMVSIKSIVYDNAQVKQLLETGELERPWSAQLFGHEPEVFTEAIRRLEGWPFDIIDINMGCPVPKIVKNGEGSALMTNPVLAGRIIEAAVRASARPVTVKIRKGFSPATANAPEMARVAQESGAAAVAVHGRTRDQFYAGAADWACIAEVKQAVKIPVIGNGDVFTPQAAAQMLDYTGCDAVMVARGAMGNPWLFERTLHYMETGLLLPPPDWDTRIETAVAHLRLTVAQKGERIAVPEMRKHLSWYIKGLPSASILRQKINETLSSAELEELLWDARNTLGETHAV